MENSITRNPDLVNDDYFPRWLTSTLTRQNESLENLNESEIRFYENFYVDLFRPDIKEKRRLAAQNRVNIDPNRQQDMGQEIANSVEYGTPGGLDTDGLNELFSMPAEVNVNIPNQEISKKERTDFENTRSSIFSRVGQGIIRPNQTEYEYVDQSGKSVDSMAELPENMRNIRPEMLSGYNINELPRQSQTFFNVETPRLAIEPKEPTQIEQIDYPEEDEAVKIGEDQESVSEQKAPIFLGDDKSFGRTFAQARRIASEQGDPSQGQFKWRNNVYSTMTADEAIQRNLPQWKYPDKPNYVGTGKQAEKQISQQAKTAQAVEKPINFIEGSNQMKDRVVGSHPVLSDVDRDNMADNIASYFTNDELNEFTKDILFPALQNAGMISEGVEYSEEALFEYMENHQRLSEEEKKKQSEALTEAIAAIATAGAGIYGFSKYVVPAVRRGAENLVMRYLSENFEDYEHQREFLRKGSSKLPLKPKSVPDPLTAEPKTSSTATPESAKNTPKTEPKTTARKWDDLKTSHAKTKPKAKSFIPVTKEQPKPKNSIGGVGRNINLSLVGVSLFTEIIVAVKDQQTLNNASDDELIKSLGVLRSDEARKELPKMTIDSTMRSIIDELIKRGYPREALDDSFNRSKRRWANQNLES